jgi:hypothetical protein
LLCLSLVMNLQVLLTIFFAFVDVVVGEFATCSCFLFNNTLLQLQFFFQFWSFKNYSFVTLFSMKIENLFFHLKIKLFMAIYNMNH